MLGDCAAALAERNIRLSWTPAAVALIADKSYSVKYGARNMRRYIETEVEDRVSSEIVREKGNVSAVEIDAADGAITVRSV